MKYLVNRETKEHIVFYADVSVPYPHWDIVEADSEGWIPWSGGECPLPSKGEYRIKLRNGEEMWDARNPEGHGSMWRIDNHPADIIAYRPIFGPWLPSSFGVDHAVSFSEPAPVAADVFHRLRTAAEHAASIPSIIAEIDALLPEGYCITKKDTLTEGAFRDMDRQYSDACRAMHLAEDMGDWRNWQVGDRVVCESTCGGFIEGVIYTISWIKGQAFRVDNDSDGKPNGWHPRYFRFHSRPTGATK